MRISDWSSDVCSSDLRLSFPIKRGFVLCSALQIFKHETRHQLVSPSAQIGDRVGPAKVRAGIKMPSRRAIKLGNAGVAIWICHGLTCLPVQNMIIRIEVPDQWKLRNQKPWRSEEHTSELKSIMRKSYD